MQFSFFPSASKLLILSYCKENISFLVGRKIFAWVKKKKNGKRIQGFIFISAFMEGVAKPLTS